MIREPVAVLSVYSPTRHCGRQLLTTAWQGHGCFLDHPEEAYSSTELQGSTRQVPSLLSPIAFIQLSALNLRRQRSHARAEQHLSLHSNVQPALDRASVCQPFPFLESPSSDSGAACWKASAPSIHSRFVAAPQAPGPALFAFAGCGRVDEHLLLWFKNLPALQQQGHSRGLGGFLAIRLELWCLTLLKGPWSSRRSRDRAPGMRRRGLIQSSFSPLGPLQPRIWKITRRAWLVVLVQPSSGRPRQDCCLQPPGHSATQRSFFRLSDLPFGIFCLLVTLVFFVDSVSCDFFPA